MVTTNTDKGKAKATKARSSSRSNPIVTPPVSPNKKTSQNKKTSPKKRVVIDYSKRESNECQIFTPKVS